MAAEGVIEYYGLHHQHIKSKLINARTVAAAGAAIRCEGQNRHTIMVSATGGTSFAYNIQFSPDAGTTWINYWSASRTVLAGATEGHSIEHFDADMVRINLTAVTGSTADVWYRGRADS